MGSACLGLELDPHWALEETEPLRHRLPRYKIDLPPIIVIQKINTIVVEQLSSAPSPCEL
jgi:hypothetical protein